MPKDAVLAAAVAAAVALVVFPVPTALLDVLLAAQLGLATVILLTALGARHPLALSQFPTVLLLTTLLRLALNVSTTRLILADGDAGAVVAAFGAAVVAQDVLVGAVVFGVITLVQYLVIAQGAERVAQVSARFALDGLPGRQLAIDADLRAGLIDPDTARARRAQLDRASSLFGAMDGAMKFVRGDAIAGLAVVGLNVAGGLVIGVARRGLSLEEAATTYTTLTVGDGLLAQLPAVLTATAAALLVTRVVAPEAEGPADALIAEFASDRRALLSAAGLIGGLGLLPGLPAVPLLGVALGLGALAWRARPAEAGPSRPRGDPAPPLAALGLALHPDAAATLGPGGPEAVVQQAASVLATRWGVSPPKPRLRIAPEGLPPGGFRVEVGEAMVSQGTLNAGEVFVCPRGPGDRPGTHPVTGGPGGWAAAGEGQAPADWLVDHLVTRWRQAGAHLLSVQATAAAVSRLEASEPALVRAVIPRQLDTPGLAVLLRALLAEGLHLRGLSEVFEALASGAPPDPEERLARVRRSLAGRITAAVAPEGQVDALFARRDLEAQLRSGALSPGAAEAVLEQLDAALAGCPQAAWLVAPDVRALARRLVAERLPGLPVIAAEELLPGTRTLPVAFIELD